jgi:hypothetical protein
MEEARFSMDPPNTIRFPAPEIDDATSAASAPYVGRWNRLVSTTNWDKGAIIAQWRDLLIEQNLPVAEYSDETWARIVGGVTGQHVGRLRRVYQRFGGVYEQYVGLYWSHFQSALDWEDAEMWLEGAVQNRWSVNEMRRNRWETLGAVPEQQPKENEIVATETDEDFEPAKNETQSDAKRESTPFDEATAGPTHEGPDFGEDREPSENITTTAMTGVEQFISADANVPAVRPFENLPDLPEDVAEAFEAFKLAILQHRTSGWQAISREDLVASLDALKALALAPVEEEAPFA